MTQILSSDSNLNGTLQSNVNLRGEVNIGGGAKYTAGEGIDITDNVISNTITSTSQLTNDSGFITNNYQVYSTTETRIGTWIDGSPIYRKVYTGLKTPSTNSSWATINQDASLEYNKIINIGGYVYLNDYNNNEFHSIQTCEGSYYIHTKISYNQNKTCIDMIQNGWKNKDCVVILEYTKN